jgi:hypothetical protein
MAGFRELADGLQPPNFARGGAKLPEVSGRMPKYSRFWETGTGDGVRSALRGRWAVFWLSNCPCRLFSLANASRVRRERAPQQVFEKQRRVILAAGMIGRARPHPARRRGSAPRGATSDRTVAGIGKRWRPRNRLSGAASPRRRSAPRRRGSGSARSSAARSAGARQSRPLRSY